MSETTDHPASLIPAQPAMLVVGERRIPLDEWPLARSVEERRSVELRRPSDDLLLIEPNQRAAAGAIGRTLLVVLGGASPSLFAAVDAIPWWLSAVMGLVVASLLLLLIRSRLSQQRWLRFDRQAGWLTIERKVGFRRVVRVEQTYPLASIRAVQLLYSGRHSVTEPEGAGERQTISYREFCGYELNLILDDFHSPRLNLFSMTDWEWLRNTGQTLGEFLAVPVIDKLYHGA